MGRDSFHQLLQRYLDGQCTPAEERLVDHWYHMLERDDKHEINASNLDVLEDAMWQKIHGQINDTPDVFSNRPPLLHSRYVRYLLDRLRPPRLFVEEIERARSVRRSQPVQHRERRR